MTATVRLSVPESGSALIDATGTAAEVAGELGLAHAVPPGTLPFALHDVLLRRPDATSVADAITEPFTVAGREFHWLLPATASRLWDEVGLTGHRLVLPGDDQRATIVAALEFLASRPWAFDLVAKYVTTLAFVESDSDADLITSCSLPDFPLCIFFSARAARHVPPVTVTDFPSARLMAENIYHESVHQSVNHLLLTRKVFKPGYSSTTSPKVPIYWRQTASRTRNRAWELDRVLHAAAVYSQLLQWRTAELRADDISEREGEAVRQASKDAVGAVRSLAAALTEHCEHFTSSGALFVGRLVESATLRAELLEHLLRRAALD
ncbi:hypothetical protein [Lentzea sp. NPDC003310]|uniref:hypothetical protein n=1 Tax=Lentzea sp. NPDC003310 TaxID=3154447 RepID=UPI0033AFEFA4